MLMFNPWHSCAKNPDTNPLVAGVFSYLHLKGTTVAMATQQTQTHSVDTGSHTSPQVAVIKALQEARKHRHHNQCRCFRYGRLYCSAADALWSNAMNRELDNVKSSSTGQA